jgi:hypothetical protein
VKVGIDLTALLPEATGVDTYLKQLVVHLGQIDTHNQYMIFVTYEGGSILKGVVPKQSSSHVIRRDQGWRVCSSNNGGYPQRPRSQRSMCSTRRRLLAHSIEGASGICSLCMT